jgi:uncharacterized protein (UPF0332 family)
MRTSSESSSELWEKVPLDKEMTGNALKLAERDLRTAKDVFANSDYDWSFSIAYNAMLQAGRALMFSQGFRPKGEHKHISVIEFIRKKYKGEFAEQILFMFNKIRKKRHIAVYEQADIISRDEAASAMNVAEEFARRVKEIIK